MAEHMQLATEEGQEMLLEEIPESPSAKPRHWYLAGAGLALCGAWSGCQGCVPLT